MAVKQRRSVASRLPDATSSAPVRRTTTRRKAPCRSIESLSLQILRLYRGTSKSLDRGRGDGVIARAIRRIDTIGPAKCSLYIDLNQPASRHRAHAIWHRIVLRRSARRHLAAAAWNKAECSKLLRPPFPTDLYNMQLVRDRFVAKTLGGETHDLAFAHSQDLPVQEVVRSVDTAH